MINHLVNFMSHSALPLSHPISAPLMPSKVPAFSDPFQLARWLLLMSALRIFEAHVIPRRHTSQERFESSQDKTTQPKVVTWHPDGSKPTSFIHVNFSSIWWLFDLSWGRSGVRPWTMRQAKLEGRWLGMALARTRHTIVEKSRLMTMQHKSAT
jgi:hypothetical protein